MRFTRRLIPGAFLLLAAGPLPVAARADEVPLRVGQCVGTAVRTVGWRLRSSSGRPLPDTGSLIAYANQTQQVSCRTELPISHSRVGDRVRLCLARISLGAPPARVFTATNQRTGERWTLGEVAHNCD